MLIAFAQQNFAAQISHNRGPTFAFNAVEGFQRRISLLHLQLNAAQKFAADSKNTYGAFASLELAQQFVEKNDLQNAEKQLQQGLAAASDDNLKSVINMRLARVQLQLKQPDAALKTLDAVKGEGWTAIVADLRGEILLSKGDKQGAKAAWEAGAKSDASPALSEMMRMKINNLSI